MINNRNSKIYNIQVTEMPLCSTLCSSAFIYGFPKFFLALQQHKLYSPFSSITMSNSQQVPIDLRNYPTPISPPLPLISKDIELARAMTASSKSSLYTLSRGEVLFEDDWLMAVNKPSGIYCERLLESAPLLLAGGLPEGTESSKLELHLANRLDRDTSGVMIITKSHKVASKLVKAFTNHKVHKTYIASCIGSVPNWKKITVKSGHGRSKFGAWRVYAASDVNRVLPGGSIVRDMETSVEVLSVNNQETFKEAKDDEGEVIVVNTKTLVDSNAMKKDEILIRAYPRSGRTHQIRLHCQYLGIPIRGDVKYEGVYDWKGRMFECHQLHAESLNFEHPMTGDEMVIRAPLPSWATQGLQTM